MKSAVKKCAVFLLALLVLPLSACGGREERPAEDPVSLWFVEGTPLSGQLAALVREYNGARSGGPEVELRSFESEEALAEAFSALPPDLLLCRDSRAFELYGRGMLKDAALGQDTPDYGALADYSPAVGAGFYPLGVSRLLLFAREDVFPGGLPGTADELTDRAARYGRENDSPFITADSFGDVIYDMMLSLGSEFMARRDRDISDPDYRQIYNALAGAAYDGGLLPVDFPAAQLVLGGAVPCAVVSSQQLAGLKTESFAIAPAPRAGQGQDYLAECFGLALTVRPGRDAGPAVRFLRYLNDPERLGAAASAAGLAPAFDCPVPEDSPLAAALAQSGGEPHLPSPGCSFMKNRDAFEAEIRAALAQLYQPEEQYIVN